MKNSVFHGGVTLEPRKVAVKLPTPRLAPQPIYAVPLSTRGGQLSEPLVEIGEQVLGGQCIAGGELTVGVHAPTSGTVQALRTGGRSPHILIATDGLHQHLPSRPPIDPKEARIEDLRAAGLVGMGGAGFPTADKLQATAGHSPSLLLVNAVECEPMISCDAQLIAEDAETLLYGADWLRRFVGAERCQIVVEDHHPETLERLTATLHELAYSTLSIVTVPTRYPAGSERQLVHAMTGTPLPPGKRPLDSGVLVQNTATVHALGRWVLNGSPLTERLVTLTGAACQNPQTLWCPIGTPLSALLEQVGVAESEVELFEGGPVMGSPIKDSSGSIHKHTQCLRIEHPSEPLNTLACIRCGLCAEACPEQLLPQQLHWQLLGENLPGAQAERLTDCILCACCDLVCPSKIPLSQQFADGKKDLQLHQYTEQRAAKAKRRVEARALRMEAKERERKERLAKRKAKTSTVDKQKAVAEAMARSRARKKAQADNAGKSHD